MEFKSPLILLLIPTLSFALYFFRSKIKDASFNFPTSNIVKDAPISLKSKFYRFPIYLRLIALSLLIVALAGPRKVLDQTVVTSEGIDIVLTLDISGSMAAEDYIVDAHRMNRLETIKKVVKEFISKRVSDRIGLVVFGSRAYTVCPLTTDYNWLQENLKQVRLGVVEDSTAIGLGITQSLLHFKDSQAKSKVVILLTDGGNNAGRIEPLSAAKAAQALGVKIYTVGAGSNGDAPVPVSMFGQRVYQTIPVQLEEEPLKEIASMTKARYFRAADTEQLKQVYKEIDALEKTRIQKKGYRQYNELFWIFILIALGLIALDIILSNTILLKIP